MKKILLILVLMFSSIMLVACNKTNENNGSITLDISSNYKEYIKYDNIPSFTLSFDGNLNTIETVNKSYYTVFSNNDDIILSDAMTELFKEYEGKVYFEVQEEKTTKERFFSHLENGKVKNEKMVCDDNKSYNEVAYIPLSNGLKLTIDYCRFVSNGITYYTWQYERSISFFLYYPLMKVKNEGNVELVLLTIPNRVSIHVSPELKLSNVIEKDDYYDAKMYTFEYVEGDTLEAKKEAIWNYYEDYNISSRSDSFTFIYLNNKFSVELNEENFVISFVERIK